MWIAGHLTAGLDARHAEPQSQLQSGHPRKGIPSFIFASLCPQNPRSQAQHNSKHRLFLRRTFCRVLGSELERGAYFFRFLLCLFVICLCFCGSCSCVVPTTLLSGAACWFLLLAFCSLLSASFFLLLLFFCFLLSALYRFCFLLVAFGFMRCAFYVLLVLLSACFAFCFYVFWTESRTVATKQLPLLLLLLL